MQLCFDKPSLVDADKTAAVWISDLEEFAGIGAIRRVCTCVRHVSISCEVKLEMPRWSQAAGGGDPCLP